MTGDYKINKVELTFSSTDAQPCTGVMMLDDDGERRLMTGLKIAVPASVAYVIPTDSLDALFIVLVDTFSYQIAGHTVLGGKLVATSATHAVISIDDDHHLEITLAQDTDDYSVVVNAEGADPGVYLFGDSPYDALPLITQERLRFLMKYHAETLAALAMH